MWEHQEKKNMMMKKKKEKKLCVIQTVSDQQGCLGQPSVFLCCTLICIFFLFQCLIYIYYHNILFL